VKASLRTDQGRGAARAAAHRGHRQPALLGEPRPRSPRKQTGFVLDLGGPVKPFVTPDDPASFEAALRAHSEAPTEDRDALLI
jgi:hypothetical protein